MSLTDSRAVRNDDAVGLFLWPAHISLELSAMHLAIAMDGVYLAIIVEKDREIVDLAHHIVVLPWSMDIL